MIDFRESFGCVEGIKKGSKGGIGPYSHTISNSKSFYLSYKTFRASIIHGPHSSFARFSQFPRRCNEG
jgi:hypothetical protein